MKATALEVFAVLSAIVGGVAWAFVLYVVSR